MGFNYGHVALKTTESSSDSRVVDIVTLELRCYNIKCDGGTGPLVKSSSFTKNTHRRIPSAPNMEACVNRHLAPPHYTTVPTEVSTPNDPVQRYVRTYVHSSNSKL
ncbi:hypothetical protein CBL_11801 [Carabus blaptoides fortunei]